jgi:hypothetical protein
MCEFHLNFVRFEAFEGQKGDNCSVLHLQLCFASPSAKNEATHKGAPYRSMSLKFRLLNRLFRKEYRYGLLISPFSTGEATTLSTPDIDFSQRPRGSEKIETGWTVLHCLFAQVRNQCDKLMD